MYLSSHLSVASQATASQDHAVSRSIDVHKTISSISSSQSALIVTSVALLHLT